MIDWLVVPVILIVYFLVPVFGMSTYMLYIYHNIYIYYAIYIYIYYAVYNLTIKD